MKRIAIKAEQYPPVLTRTEDGLTIDLSSYDIPREISTEMKDGVMHICFSYVDKEEDNSKELADHVKVKIGKYSGKILGFELDVKKLDIKRVALKIEEAVEQESRQLTKFNQKANYQFVKEVVARNLGPMLAGAF